MSTEKRHFRFPVGTHVRSVRDLGYLLEDSINHTEVNFLDAIVLQQMPSKFPYSAGKYYKVSLTDSELNKEFRRKYDWMNTFTIHEDYLNFSENSYTNNSIYV